jgi:hypothetical protein
VKRLAVVLALAFSLVPAASAAKLTYKTTFQAQRYLEHGLSRWSGANLRSRKYKFHVAFCLPGYRSKYEQRHTRFRVHTTKAGEHLYHSFACTLAAADRVWHLYLLARPDGTFDVRADRA